ncbi:probable lysophospholipase BODYGUARD 4 [Coffea eugenioides]|uniref:probable lysophospholipase BODYGUARD 4 n=1 Tax=Coffea eugenioides TaxID=49369 RepID=UPI000F60BEDE|nr:probable lysophospholipase BODYGUARD 4 [Coffea eugenioides]
MATLVQSGKWIQKGLEIIIAAISWMVFLFLDFLEVFMCIFYRLLDEFLEGKAYSSCYCMELMEEKEKTGDCHHVAQVEVDGESELSETLHRRRNFFRGLLGSLGISLVPKGWRDGESFLQMRNGTRWSDCGCDSCVEWMKNADDPKLHVVVQEPQTERASWVDSKEREAENVIFLHGFLSSSSFWTETVFPNLSESAKQNCRLFAVDLLGFGRSPKPRDCFYTLKDHLEMIEYSVIGPYQLNSFHLVAHSMGCIIALALAAKHSKSVKSITLIAPPYFSSLREDASMVALERLAAKRLWPPLLFGSSFMSWYEHLGRCVCFIICRNHQMWESLLKFITRRRNLHFTFIDLTRHTHHSAWHTMHNVICGGAKLADKYLETLRMAKVKINVIQGTRDQVVPIECSINIQKQVQEAEIDKIANANHGSVVLGREKDFTRDLERIWSSVADLH